MMTRTGHAENVYPGCRFHGTPDRQSRRRSAHAYDPMGRLTQVIDAGGTQTRTYNQYGDVVTENYPLGAASSSLISRSYDSLGRQTLVSLNNSCVASYTFDSVTGRYASIGNGTAVMTYGYLPQTDQISSQSWKVGTSAAFLTISNTYDAFTRPTRIDANSAMQATYAYDVMNRRTSAAIQDSSCWQYSYNPRMEVTSAVRKNASSVTQNTMRYDYDTIGNRTSSYENPTSKTYLSNNRNQYEEITSGSSTTYPGYDNDGNMTENGSWEYRWDSENRLILAKNGTKKIVFTYDAFSRRITKKVYSSTSLSKHEHYVYDGDKLLAVYNARSSYAKTASFHWSPIGLDVPLSMTSGTTKYYYLCDANKNITGLFNASGSRVATYLYGPFGQILSSSGTMASTNPFRFSAEQYDDDLALVYYLYRYYSPVLGRWLSKDPLEFQGGLNLYLMCGNESINEWDNIGLVLESVQFWLSDQKDKYMSMDKVQNIKKEIDDFKQKMYSIYQTKIPKPPKRTDHQANWLEMTEKWFFELGAPVETFEENSPQSIDIANSYSMSVVLKEYCRTKKIPEKWEFNGPGSATGNYTEIEWFLGTYHIKNFKLDNNIATFTVYNVSSWHSGTRLPKTWTAAIKEQTDIEILDLVTSAERGEVLKQKILTRIPFDITKIPGVSSVLDQLPSFGGNWTQNYKIRMQWCCPESEENK